MSANKEESKTPKTSPVEKTVTKELPPPSPKDPVLPRRIPSSFDSSALNEGTYIFGDDWLARFRATKVPVELFPSPSSATTADNQAVTVMIGQKPTTESASVLSRGFEVTAGKQEAQQSAFSLSDEEQEKEETEKHQQQQRRSIVGCYPQRDVHQQQQKQQEKQQVKEVVKKYSKDKEKKSLKNPPTDSEAPTVLLGSAIPPDYVNYYAGKKVETPQPKKVKKKFTDGKKPKRLAPSPPPPPSPAPSDAPTELIRKIQKDEKDKGKKKERKLTKEEEKRLIKLGEVEDGGRIWRQLRKLRQRYGGRRTADNHYQHSEQDKSLSTSKTSGEISTLSSPSIASTTAERSKSPEQNYSSSYIGLLMEADNRLNDPRRRRKSTRKVDADGGSGDESCCCCC